LGLRTVESEFELSYNPDSTLSIVQIEDKSIFTEESIDQKNYLKDLEVSVEWPNNNLGKIRFKTLNYNELYDELYANIETNKKIKTNIFEINTRSNHPFASKLIANTIADKFRENRISLQKDNIKSTFSFIDERLNEVALNLTIAENNLSNFKSSEKIAQIDEQSKKLVEFISNLESEKLKNDLELSFYTNRLNNIEKQMAKGTYVDQTYLTPEQYQNTNSPFSTLLNELSNLELQKLELLQKRTELHPDVILISEQIERIKTELSKFNKNTVTAYRIISNALNNKQYELGLLVSKYSKKIEALPAKEAKLASLIRQRDAYEKMYTLLLDKREEMRLAELSKMQDIVILDRAIEAIKPVAPHKKLNLLFASIFGLIFGLFGTLLAQINDKKINDISDLENEFSYPILTVIPPYEKKVADQIQNTDKIRDRFISMMDDNFRFKEAFRTLEIKLSSKIEGKPKTLMITSCEEDAGKTSIASNLALTIAQSNKKVLLIDCDIKAPAIAERFGLPKFSSGLVDYLTEKSDSPNIYKPVKLTKNSNLLMNLDIIPTGNFSNISGEVLASSRMKDLLSALGYYDFIILDTPPITRLSDALSLSRLVKDTVLVVRSGQTIKESISWAISELKTSDINFQGLVVNDCEIKSNNYKYQYGYVNK
jgi:capsular exopolysaccharide synthesis family protein